MNLAMQIVAYSPSGERRGVLPYPLAASITDVMNDGPQSTIDYHADAPQSPLLEGLGEVAVEVSNGGAWTEPGPRLLRLQRSASVIDESRTRRYTLPSYGFQFTKIRMLREELLDSNGERIITGMTPGGLLKTLIDEAKARGNVPQLAYDFTAERDSAGVPWADTLPPQSLRFGDDLMSLMRTLADNGRIDWRVQGRTLRVYRADGLGVDRSATVKLWNGIDILEAPDREDGSEMAGRIGVVGDGGRTYEAISPSAGPWGLWEEVVNASGVKDIGGLQFIGETEQRRRSAPRVQMTRAIRVAGVKWLPFSSYGVGDTITAPDQNGQPAPLRVRELALSLGSDGLAVNATLNDRILERDIRNQRTVTGLLGGAGASVGGSGLPAPAGEKKQTPSVPSGLTVTSAHLYTPVGEPFAVIDAAFAPVVADTAGAAIAVDHHELYARENVSGEPWRKLTDGTADSGRITYSPLPAGQDWQFKVRAISKQGVPGEFTTPVTLTLAADTTPPNTPSTPVGNSRLGQMILSWDGRDSEGVAQPVDFSHVSVWMAPSAGGAGEIVGRMTNTDGDTFVAPMQDYNSSRWFWLTAVDTSGNESGPSTRVKLVTTPLVGEDLIGEVVDGSNIKARSIVSGKIASNAVTADKIAAGAVTAEKIDALSVTAEKIDANAVTADKLAAEAVSAEKIKAGAVTAAKIAANAITAEKLDAGAITAEKLAADAITGKTITGGTIKGAKVNADSGIVVSPGGSITIEFPLEAGGVGGVGLGASPYFGLSVAGSLNVRNYLRASGGLQASLGFSTQAANVRSLGNQTNMERVSSMRRLKLDREEIPADYALLDLPGRTWRDREMVERDPDTSVRVAGFVAEDLATLTAFNGGSFDSLLEVDQDGRATGIQYDRIVAFLLPIIRDLHDRVTRLESDAAN